VTLRAVDLDVPGCGVTALVGPSGAGKTSLLRLLNRLDDPIRGVVSFRGEPIMSYPIRDLRRRVGFVFQAPVMFPGTVADNLAAGSRVAGTADHAAREVEEVLALCGLDPSYASREAARLSGGEQQRVSIARALITRPEVLLLDEPTSALDPEVADRLMGTVRHLVDAMRLTIVMVTHRLAEARTASTHTVMLEGGRVVEAGPTSAMFTAPSEGRTRAYLIGRV
jgi:putative ABC transport system ATP-binding protein